MEIKAVLLSCFITFTPLIAQEADYREVEPELQAKINKAIDKGVEWLKSKQDYYNGDWGDSTEGFKYAQAEQVYDYRPEIAAFALLALLKSDVPPNDQVIIKGFKFLDDYLKAPNALITDYGKAVILMAKEARYEAEAKQAQKKAPPPKAPPKQDKGMTQVEWVEPKYKITTAESDYITRMTSSLVVGQAPDGGWRYGMIGADPGIQDVSATHFVLMGLKSAVRLGMKVHQSSFDRGLMYLLNSQEKDGPKVGYARNLAQAELPGIDPQKPETTTGDDFPPYMFVPDFADKARGWSYMPDSTTERYKIATGSMTTAGVMGLLVCKSEMQKSLSKEMLSKIDQSIYDGLSWLWLNYTVKKNPEGFRSHYYYLYGLERICVLGGVEKLVDKLWYKEGAKLLVGQQNPKGFWFTDTELPPGDIYDTCYALLFLKRGVIQLGPVYTYRGGKTEAVTTTETKK